MNSARLKFFSGRLDDRFADLTVDRGPLGNAWLNDALATADAEGMDGKGDELGSDAEGANVAVVHSDGDSDARGDAEAAVLGDAPGVVDPEEQGDEDEEVLTDSVV